MMADLKIKNTENVLDVEYSNGELQADSIFFSGVVNSLFSNSSITEGEAEIAKQKIYYGWWSENIGSKFWLIERTTTDKASNLINDYISNSLDWIKEHDVQVQTSMNANRLDITITVEGDKKTYGI